MANPFREPQRYGGQLPQQPPHRSDSDSSQAETGTYPANPVLLPKYNHDPEDPRMKADMARTPSPTPSEQRELEMGVVDWKALRNWRFWLRREWLWYYVATVVILVVVALVSIYHTQIVHWLTPTTQRIHDLKFGWLIPIAVLFVISFPPLFGHEIVAILSGLVWGLWVGFGIVCAGTFLGEVGNFYAFKYCCRARGEKLERTKISYACLAKVVRDGGFKIALIARLSAIPGHFTTAVFSTCGMGIVVFSIAAILSLPKQFITVYLGVILEQSGTGAQTSRSRLISNVVLAITFLITILAGWYIFHKVNKVKPEVIYQRRKARQAKLARGDYTPYNTASAFQSTSGLNDPFEPSDSIPLRSRISTSPTPDTAYPNDRAQGSPGHLYAPQPRHGAGYGPLYEASSASTSTDEVGWDTRVVQHAKVEEMYGHPMGPPESSETVALPPQGSSGRARGAYGKSEYDEAYGGLRRDSEATPYVRPTQTQGPSSSSTSQHPPPLHPPSLSPRQLTPQPASVQAQYASWTPPPSSDLASDITLGPLPSPSFHQTHMATTPVRSTDTRGGDELLPPRALVSSPPPPSYHTDTGR